MFLISSITKLLHWRKPINIGSKLVYIQIAIECAALQGGTLQQSCCQIYFPSCGRGNCFPTACSQINTCCSVCSALCAPSTLQMWLGTQTWQITAPRVPFTWCFLELIWLSKSSFPCNEQFACFPGVSMHEPFIPSTSIPSLSGLNVLQVMTKVKFIARTPQIFLHGPGMLCNHRTKHGSYLKRIRFQFFPTFRY